MIYPIKDWLFQGDCLSVRDHEYENYPITGIICVNENAENFWPRPGMEHLHLPMDDNGRGLTGAMLDDAVSFAARHRTGLLVRCFGCQNRSSAMCAYLLSVVDKMTDEEASCLIHARNPRMAIWGKLTEVYHSLTGKTLKNP